MQTFDQHLVALFLHASALRALASGHPSACGPGSPLRGSLSGSARVPAGRTPRRSARRLRGSASASPSVLDAASRRAAHVGRAWVATTSLGTSRGRR
jgi:hypothetical protein